MKRETEKSLDERRRIADDLDGLYPGGIFDRRRSRRSLPYGRRGGYSLPAGGVARVIQFPTESANEAGKTS